jgi:hypothetical protein
MAGDWGQGAGDWGLGTGDWGLGTGGAHLLCKNLSPSCRGGGGGGGGGGGEAPLCDRTGQ